MSNVRVGILAEKKISSELRGKEHAINDTRLNTGVSFTGESNPISWTNKKTDDKSAWMVTIREILTRKLVGGEIISQVDQGRQPEKKTGRHKSRKLPDELPWLKWGNEDPCEVKKRTFFFNKNSRKSNNVWTTPLKETVRNNGMKNFVKEKMMRIFVKYEPRGKHNSGTINLIEGTFCEAIETTLSGLNPEPLVMRHVTGAFNS